MMEIKVYDGFLKAADFGYEAVIDVAKFSPTGFGHHTFPVWANHQPDHLTIALWHVKPKAN